MRYLWLEILYWRALDLNVFDLLFELNLSRLLLFTHFLHHFHLFAQLIKRVHLDRKLIGHRVHYQLKCTQKLFFQIFVPLIIRLLWLTQMAPQSGNSHILQQTLLIHHFPQLSLENDQETIIRPRQYSPVPRNKVYVRSHIFLDHYRWFLVFVLLLVIEQPADVLVPDNAVDQDLLVDCFFWVGKGWFWVQAHLELRWVDRFVLGFGVSKGLLNGSGQWIALLKLDHVQKRPDFLRHWRRVSLFLLMIDKMRLSPERPSPLTSAFVFLKFSTIVLLGHCTSMILLSRRILTGLFNIIGSK